MDLSPDSGSPTPGDDLRKADTVDGTKSRLRASQVIGGRYEILERLGRGQMGEVWRAYDLKLRVDVALKSVRRTTPHSLEALRREVRIAREVVSPNVCRVFDLIEAEGQEFISMEFIDGQTLLAFIRDKSPLDLHEANEIASQFLAGLEAIHRAGLVHRDFKPENIMITRTGRVVVMDFGIAELEAHITSTISGTPPYMAPEQLLGVKVDARFDLFAAGTVLAEMMSTIRDSTSRKAVWNRIREDPPKLPDNPWRVVIARAVAKNPEERFPSALALSNALKEVVRRIDTIQEKNPYPGLSSFTEADAEYFLGRELEIEIVLKRLQDLHLMAIIGPSGAGKTSFLHAGLIPVLPSGWSYVFASPGDSPLQNVGQALATEFSGDPQAIRKMVRLDDLDNALWLLHRWRQNHSEAVLIMDQFEELFTLNDRETQRRFAELIGEAALKADVRVLLVLRDDFLIFCKEQNSLAPIFSELTVLLPLSGEALKRALIDPALRCGYRFEDEALIDEILSDVEKERGALPLMAFATSRLWEKRDRQNGLLLRTAYKDIGGVGGALSQHAEATMERIGSERLNIVREIFRNLVTAQKTRAVRDAEELLSIFEDRSSAEQVLKILIDARLLTSFELSRTETEKARRRVEIIHESLLSAWPRLVRWQTQDADHAQFRDQFRQAAHVWDERGRPTDLLWTGSSYQEFDVWRKQYSGGLTAIEKAFADAMLQHAHNKRVKRRLLLSTTFVILMGVLVLIAILWRSEKSAHQEADLQTQRSEASKLLALGQTELDQDPTIALAYAIASLERADSQVARRFALRALWKGPPAFITNMPVRPATLDFSPNGKWIVAGGYGGARLMAQDGKQGVLAEGVSKLRWWEAPQFSPKGDLLVWASSHDLRIVRVWSILQGKDVQQFKMEGSTSCLVRGAHAIMITDLSGNTARTFQWERTRIRLWSFDKNDPKIVGQWNLKGTSSLDVSNDARLVAYGRNESVYVRPVEGSEDVRETFVGKHEADVTRVIFHPTRNEISSVDVTGEIRMWSLLQDSKIPLRTIPSRGQAWKKQNNAMSVTFSDSGNIFFNPSGSIFAAAYPDKTLCFWDMNGPLDADPFIFQRNVAPSYPDIAFDLSRKWAVVNYADSLAFWPLRDIYPYILRGTGDFGATGLDFTIDGKQLAAAFGHGFLRLWNVAQLREPRRDLWRPANETIFNLEMDPTGKYLSVATSRGGYVISIADGTARKMPGAGIGHGVFSPNGKLLAAESYGDIPVWDLESDKVRVLTGKMPNYGRLRFAGENLFSSDLKGNIYKWNLKKETAVLFAKGNKPLGFMEVPSKAQHLFICLWTDLEQVDDREFRSELRVFDLRTTKSYPIASHGDRVSSIAIDPSGTVLISGDIDGTVRVGPITGEEPHLLYGHQCIARVAIDPELKWIASSECQRPVVRLWPMPKGAPLHSLSRDELLKRLRALTNMRVIADEKSSTGYRIQFDRFPGWEKTPTW